MKKNFTFTINPFPHLKGDLVAAVIGFSLAITLYLFGLKFPTDARITGDAAEYMKIAAQFENLHSALTFVGERSSGMPIFNWLFKPKTSEPVPNFEDWATVVCTALLCIHLLASLLAVVIARDYTPIRTRNGLRFLFVFLVSFPAFIGHTTTPLTDTLAVDLSLFLLATMLWLQKLNGGLAYMAASLIGIVSAYNCLLRPAYLIPTIASLLVFTFLALPSRKTVAFVSILTFGLCLGVTSVQCNDRYGQACLQNPKTFNPISHAQMGLRGGRLLWSGPYPTNGEFPILPDRVLNNTFYERCKLDRIIGLDSSSLTGCLLTRPHLIPVYIGKKWIGLFDHFRFQPYVEQETPSWLVVMSRLYDQMAWVGFLFCIVVTFDLLFRRRQSIKINGAITAYLIFVFLMLAEHTILHPEDRFGLVLIPSAAVGFVVFIERLRSWVIQRVWPQFVMASAMTLISIIVFTWQVISWDHTQF